MIKNNKYIWIIRLSSLGLFLFSYFKAVNFEFLILNSILAYIPIEIGNLAIRKNQNFFWIIFTFWLLMIPNTFYLLTDLYYLTKLQIFTKTGLKVDELLWRHYLILVVSVIYYLVIGLYSVEDVITKIYQKFNRVIPKFILVVSFFIINGIAIYIGRFLRFHSIEIFKAPITIFKEINSSIKTINYY